jgi:hypothetical protein
MIWNKTINVFKNIFPLQKQKKKKTGCFIIYFDLFFMRLSQSYDSGHMFCGLTQVDSNYFIVFFLDWFFFKKKINLQQWIYWKLGFIICFDLLYVKLSLFHDICRGFDKVTRVELSYFFYLLSIRLSRSYNSNYEFDRLTQVIFLIIFFNFIFNIGLIENWTL